MRAWETNVRKVVPYTPGEQPDKEKMIKLNTNENPYPPSPAVRRALEQTDYDALRLYPDPAASGLVRALAERYKVGEDQIFVGVGSDDVLSMAFLTFFNSKKPVLFPDITYSFYPVWCDVYRILYETRPLTSDFSIRASDYYGQNGGVIFPNPNAPTSRYETLSVVEDIVAHNPDSVVIVDEAYIDFAGASAVSLVPKYDNLLVVQTFSKSRALAGMRIGFAIGQPKLIQAMSDVRYSVNSYTMSRPAIEAGVASAADEEYFQMCVGKIKETRAWTAAQLKRLGFKFCEPSANFIFATHPVHRADRLFALLREQDIYVRYFDKPGIDNYLRITIGTDAQMRVLIETLRDIIG